MLLKKTKKVGNNGDQCNSNTDCNSGAGLECAQGVCSCQMTFQWNAQTLKCDMCATNYVKRGNYCGLFAYLFCSLKGKS